MMKSFFIASILFAPFLINAQAIETQAQKEIRLQAELAQVLKEQAETEKILIGAQNQSASLKRDILILDTKIKAAQLNIKAKNLIIESLGKDINSKKKEILSLEERIDRGRETLSQIMRKTNEVDEISLAEFILASKDLSIVFSDLDTFESVRASLKITFEQVRDDKEQTENEKNDLDKRKNKELDARAAIESEKVNIQNDEKQKQRLLTASKGDEKTYTQLLAEKKAKAALIRAALFSLAGDTKSISFGDAYKFALEAQKATGIRPAFLLAIFAQESGLSQDSTFGKNVGSCYLTDINTGSGVSTKSGIIFSNVMKPTRDIQPFISITKALGLDYSKVLVSCPIASAGGYGGAMGPAQFIPSTWVLYVNRIKNALSVGIPNPWNPEHAFVAASLLLIDNGAKYGSYTAERNAACKYYSGKACSPKSVNNSYGNQVMVKADTIQRTMIDPLQGL